MANHVYLRTILILDLWSPQKVTGDIVENSKQEDKRNYCMTYTVENILKQTDGANTA